MNTTIAMKTNGNIFRKILVAVIACAALMTNINAQDIVIPDDPVDTPAPPLSYNLEQGYATGICPGRFVGVPTSPRECSCYLDAADTVTVHFKPVRFHYERGLGDPFPQNECRLDLRLYDTADGDSLICRLPFVVDGTTMAVSILEDYQNQDSVILVLPPGRYLLEYGGFQEYWADLEPMPSPALMSDPDGDGDETEEGAALIPASPESGNMEMLSCHSRVQLSLECLPLIDDRFVATSWNRTVERVYLDGGATPGAHMETVRWLDDFGRPTSTHQVALTPDRNTLADLIEYDACGRAVKNWLPGCIEPFSRSLPGGTAMYSDLHVREDSLKIRSAEANLMDAAPFSEAAYEGTIPERQVSQTGPGAGWRTAGRSVTTEYLSNLSQSDIRLRCRRLSLTYGDSDGTCSISSNSYYPAGTLTVKAVVDEDGRETLSFTDRLGRLVLSRQVAGEGSSMQYLDTYYIYDGLGHLMAVVPPALSSGLGGAQTLSSDELDRYAYLYRYDGRERVVAKKLPGAEWLLMAYDEADRLIYSQDGNQRLRGESTFRLYDVDGRECVSGLCLHDITPGETVQGIVRAQYAGQNGTFGGYTCEGLSLTQPQVMSVQYYDGYSFLQDMAPSGCLPDSSAIYGHAVKSTYSLLTGSCQHVLTGSVTSDTVWKLFRYDDRGRLSHTETSYGGGGYDIGDTSFDFTGNPTACRLVHKYSTDTPAVVELITYTYDHAGRRLSTYHSLNGANPVRLSQNTYDELGRLSGTGRGAASSLSSAYTYNVRSWLTGITGQEFSETIHYNDLRSGAPAAASALYGGGISSVEMRYGNSTERSYDYAYDRLGRLTSAVYGEGGETISGYGTSYSYDVMGNMLSLSRYGYISAGTKGLVDNLTMTYDGNRLVSVQDAAQAVTMSRSMDYPDGAAQAVEFTYDANGNMTSDANRGVSQITYTVSNLPATLSCGSLSESWRYLPDGTKLSLSLSDGNGQASVTDYRGNLVYKDGVLKDILTDGGLIDMTEASPRYVFFLQDHLGSVRVAAMLNGMKVQTNLYYPYGMSYASSALAGSSTVEDGGEIQVFPGGSIPEIPGTPEIAEEFISTIPYRFCGKEQNIADGLGMYDFLARRYDPVLCRFTSPDPLAEKYPSVSPYAYCANDPVNKVDPDGKKIYFATGTSEEFKQKFAATVQYMNKRGTSDNLAKLESSKDIYYIKEVSSINDVRFSAKDNNTIYWDPNHIAKTDNNLWLSPATILDHESEHALSYDRYKNGKLSTQEKIDYLKSKEKQSDVNYGTKHEKSVIEKREQSTARRHGEISNSQVTRVNHNGRQVNGDVSNMTPFEIEQLIKTNNELFQ